jgi:hypothetical protein
MKVRWWPDLDLRTCPLVRHCRGPSGLDAGKSGRSIRPSDCKLLEGWPFDKSDQGHEMEPRSKAQYKAPEWCSPDQIPLGKPLLFALNHFAKLCPQRRQRHQGIPACPIRSGFRSACSAIISRCICPDLMRGQALSVSKAKKAIADYKKAIGEPAGLTELSIFYCEEAFSFLESCAFEDERYFVALIRM